MNIWSSLPVAGYLCYVEMLGGWPSAYYLFGGLGVIWFALWSLLIFENPDQHPRITKKELDYITKDQKDEKAVEVSPA